MQIQTNKQVRKLVFNEYDVHGETSTSTDSGEILGMSMLNSPKRNQNPELSQREKHIVVDNGGMGLVIPVVDILIIEYA